MEKLPSVKLNPKQERFVELYTRLDPGYYGNATKCYIEAFMIEGAVVGNPTYNCAKAAAHNLIKEENICVAIRARIDETGFNDETADKELLFLLSQHSDLKAKLGAIKEYNLLKKRTTSGGSNPFGSGNNISITAIFNKAEDKKKEIIDGSVIEP